MRQLPRSSERVRTWNQDRKQGVALPVGLELAKAQPLPESDVNQLELRITELEASVLAISERVGKEGLSLGARIGAIETVLQVLIRTHPDPQAAAAQWDQVLAAVAESAPFDAVLSQAPLESRLRSWSAAFRAAAEGRR
jgi:hypothetical protein